MAVLFVLPDAMDGHGGLYELESPYVPLKYYPQHQDE